MLELEALRGTWEARGIGFLALSIAPDLARNRAAAQKLGLGMPVAAAQAQALAPFGVSSVPATVFVSAEGRLLGSAKTGRGRQYLDARIREILAGTR